LINNRQGGRRRGRGGQRNQNLGGNRQDNRQRGNAAQLLEKYKNMARDAQLAGDRVQNEYFLQFADHYFRMLGENRPRTDDQRRQRDDSSDEDENDDEMMDASDGDQQDEGEQNDRNDRNDRNDGGERNDRNDRGERNDRNARGNGRDRSQRNGSRQQEASNDGDERIALEVLPPAIGRDRDEQSEEDAAAKPKRRARKPRNDGDEAEVAPAA
jgi:hypothetical protein